MTCFMHKKNAIRSESILNQNTVKVYTDSWKLDGRVGADFYAEYPNNSPKQVVQSPVAFTSTQKMYFFYLYFRNPE